MPMDRVFSVGEFSDQFWSPPSFSTELDDGSSKMNRSPSVWAFEKFLEEEASSLPTQNSQISSPHTVIAPACSSSVRSKNDPTAVVEIKDDDVLSPPPTTKCDQTRTPTTHVMHTRKDGMMNATTSALYTDEAPTDIQRDSQAYQNFLKSKLNIACAAVALTRGPFIKSQEATTIVDSGSQALNSSQNGSLATFKGSGCDPLRAADKDMKEPVGIPSFQCMQKRPGAVARPSTSGSSREQSDDDDAEVDNELSENTDPADVKRVRRMLSNRESARRSRRRKQEHLTELETQVSQLRGENSSLLNRLTDVRQKYTEAAVDNRVLKADVETLRAKVKMAEETVKRITGLNPILHAMSEMSMGIPSFVGSPSDSADTAVPVQDDPNLAFYQANSNNPISSHNLSGVDNVLGDVPSPIDDSSTAVAAGNKIGQASSLQRIESLEHLQKRISGVDACGSQFNREQR